MLHHEQRLPLDSSGPFSFAPPTEQRDAPFQTGYRVQVVPWTPGDVDQGTTASGLANSFGEHPEAAPPIDYSWASAKSWPFDGDFSSRFPHPQSSYPSKAAAELSSSRLDWESIGRDIGRETVRDSLDSSASSSTQLYTSSSPSSGRGNSSVPQDYQPSTRYPPASSPPSQPTDHSSSYYCHIARPYLQPYAQPPPPPIPVAPLELLVPREVPHRPLPTVFGTDPEPLLTRPAPKAEPEALSIQPRASAAPPPPHRPLPTVFGTDPANPPISQPLPVYVQPSAFPSPLPDSPVLEALALYPVPVSAAPPAPTSSTGDSEVNQSEATLWQKQTPQPAAKSVRKNRSSSGSTNSSALPTEPFADDASEMSYADIHRQRPKLITLPGNGSRPTNAEVNKLRQQVLEQEGEIMDLKLRLAQLDPVLRERAEKAHKKMQRELEKVMKRLAAKEDEVKQLMDAMTELAEQNTELQQRAEAAESGIKSTKMIERKASKVIQREVDARRAAEAEMQRYQTVAEGVRRDVTNLQDEASKLLNRKVARDHEVFRLKKKVSELQQQLSAALDANGGSEQDDLVQGLRERNAMLEKQLAAEMTRSEEQGRAKEQYDFLMKLLEADAGELEQSGAHLASENGKLLAMLQQEKQARLQEEAKRKEAEEKARLVEEEAELMANMLCGPLAEEEHVQEAMQWRELGEQLKQSMSQLPGPSRPARNPKQSGQAPQPPAQQEGQRPEAHSQSISLGEVPTGMLIGSMDMGSRATPASGSPLNSCSDLDEEDPTRASSGPSFKHMAVPAEYQSGVANNGAAQHPNVAAVHGHGRAPLHRSSALGVGAEAQNQQKTVLEHNSSFDSQKTFVAKAPDENEGPKPWSDPDNTPLSMSLTVALPGSRFPAEDDQQTPSTAPAGAASKVNFHAAPVPRPAEHGSDSPAFQRSNSVPAIPRIRSTPRSMSMLSSSRRDVLLQELASRESRSGSNTPRSSVGSPMHRRTISQGNRSVGSTPGGGDSRSRLWLSLGGTSPA